MQMKVCRYPGCEQPHKAKGYCNAHYQRLRNHGNVTVLKSHKRGGQPSHPLYHTYFNMLGRCYNPNTDHYDRYGGRGITVCERWRGSDGFNNFVADMGDKPSPTHSIDRENVNGNYEPSNCKWATKYEQMANTTHAGPTPGVTWDKRRRNWRTRVKVNGKEHYIGCFKSRDEAVKARIAYCLKHGLV